MIEPWVAGIPLAISTEIFQCFLTGVNQALIVVLSGNFWGLLFLAYGQYAEDNFSGCLGQSYVTLSLEDL